MMADCPYHCRLSHCMTYDTNEQNDDLCHWTENYICMLVEKGKMYCGTGKVFFFLEFQLLQLFYYYNLTIRPFTRESFLQHPGMEPNEISAEKK